MSPSEVRACYQLYAAHRMSHEICAFPATIPALNNAAEPDNDLAMLLLRLHTGFKGLAGALGQGNPDDDLLHVPTTYSRVGLFRKMLSLAARLQRNWTPASW
jgi:hypothetical protein